MNFDTKWCKLLFLKLFILASLLSGCAVSGPSSGPQIGMKFRQPYASFVGGGFHDGLDLDVPLGTPVRSIGDGVVGVIMTRGIGPIKTNFVMIRHPDNTLSRYIHIDKITVKQGDSVKRGQAFAITALNGTSGPNTNAPVSYPHLHLEIFRDDLVDPESLQMTCGETGWRWPVGCE